MKAKKNIINIIEKWFNHDETVCPIHCKTYSSLILWKKIEVEKMQKTMEAYAFLFKGDNQLLFEYKREKIKKINQLFQIVETTKFKENMIIIV